MAARRKAPATGLSIAAGLAAFALDRGHKFYQVSADCIGIGQARCVGDVFAFTPITAIGWRGGEYLRVNDLFDYVLVWNTGISYGLLSAVPVWALGLLMVAAVTALAVWWGRSRDALVRIGLALAIGGALSNAVDRLLFGAVADFFHFHWGSHSFYIFNIADAAITLGVLLLVADLFGLGRRRPAGRRTALNKP